MEAITLEIVALVFAFLTLLGSQIGGLFIVVSRLDEQNKRIDDMNTEMNRRFDHVNTRFDTMNGEMNSRFDAMNQRFDETTLLIGELRDRTGKLEGTLEGFLAGRRDRDAA